MLYPKRASKEDKKAPGSMETEPTKPIYLKIIPFFAIIILENRKIVMEEFMKKLGFFWQKIIFFLILSTPYLITAANTQELDSYFARLKRGVHCIIKNKKCSDDDKKAVYQAAGAITTALVIAIAGTAVYFRDPIKAYLAKRKEEQLKKDLEKIYKPIVYKHVDTLKIEPTAQQLEKAGQCDICYEPFSGTIVKGEQCKHLWHYDCLADWIFQQKYIMGQSATCPTCQQPLFKKYWYSD
jgi:hypothetical protein